MGRKIFSRGLETKENFFLQQNFSPLFSLAADEKVKVQVTVHRVIPSPSPTQFLSPENQSGIKKRRLPLYFKGIGSQDEYFLWSMIFNRYSTFCISAAGFYNLLLYRCWKNQSFSMQLRNYLLILKTLLVTHFRDIKQRSLTLKRIQEVACDPVK
jgi:hypothetical protein